MTAFGEGTAFGQIGHSARYVRRAANYRRASEGWALRAHPGPLGGPLERQFEFRQGLRSGGAATVVQRLRRGSRWLRITAAVPLC
jgi:hypothetical protein